MLFRGNKIPVTGMKHCDIRKSEAGEHNRQGGESFNNDRWNHAG